MNLQHCGTLNKQKQNYKYTKFKFMKKQHQLIDNTGKILARSSNHRVIECKAANADCETKVVMVMIRK